MKGLTTDLARIAAMAQSDRVRLDRQEWFALYSAALGAEMP